MALAARLGVIERTKSILHTFHCVEDLLVGLVCCVIHYAIALVVKTRRRFGHLRGNAAQNQAEHTHNDPALHSSSPILSVWFTDHLPIRRVIIASFIEELSMAKPTPRRTHKKEIHTKTTVRQISLSVNFLCASDEP